MKNVRILIASGIVSDTELVMECPSAGAMDILGKPMAREILLNKVDGMLAG